MFLKRAPLRCAWAYGSAERIPTSLYGAAPGG